MLKEMVYPYIEIQRFWEWAVECIEEELEELLSFCDFPKRHWSKIRRISCFENKRSCKRTINICIGYIQ